MKELEPEVIVDGTVMDEGRVVSAIKELSSEHNIKFKQAAISISGHAVIVKKISLPPMPDEELDGQVKLAAEQYIPFDINEVNLDFHVLPPSETSPDEQGEMSIILVAAKKDKINELTELVKAAGLIPIVMDVDAFAIENMHGVSYPGSPGRYDDVREHRRQCDECQYCARRRLLVYEGYSYRRKSLHRSGTARDGRVLSRRQSN